MSHREPHNSYVVAIIAGGAAQRLHGAAPLGLKTLLPVAEHGSILEFLVDFFTTQIPPPTTIALNIHPEQHRHVQQWLQARSSPSLVSLCPSLILDDIVPHDSQHADRQGPMSGIAAALSWKKQYHPNVRWLFSISGDTVDLPSDLVARMLDIATDHQQAQWIVAANAERIQPTISLWRDDCTDQVLHQYRQGERKIDRLAQQFPHQQVVWPQCRFSNVNSLAEYNQYKPSETND